MTEKKQLGIIYGITYLLMLVVNYITSTDVGMIADRNPALIQPAGYVFSIWGLIYFLLLIWIVRLFFIDYERDRVYESVRYWLIANFILNAIWIVAFTREWYLTSFIVIVALLVTLFFIYKKITRVSTNWFDRLPFSIYFGWVTVATIVNSVEWVKETGTEEVLGLNEYQWTLILLVVGTAIAVVVSLVHLDWLYPLVFAWAYTGIIIEADYQFFWLTVVCGAGIFFHLLVSAYTGIRKLKKIR